MKRVLHLLILIIFGLPFPLSAQQNLTMYFIASNPEVNTLNPAFQNSCKLFIGLPVISSLHTNFSCDGFSYRELFQKNGSNYNLIPSGDLPRITSLNSEVYTNLFSIGLWRKKNYFTFSITEKTDFALFFHRDLYSVLLEGNTKYEGEYTQLKRTGLFFDYRREYAFGIARKINPETTIGIKAKLLFGKINISTRNSQSYIYTDPNTFDLTAHSILTVNSSAPIAVSTNAAGRITNINYTGTPAGVLFNRSNIGFAFDVGFIQKLSDKETISGSILDLGAIYYTSNPNNYITSGDYSYSGQLNSATNPVSGLNDILNNAFSNFNSTVETKSYLAFLPPRIYFNYQYAYSPKTNLNALTSAKIYKYKILPAITVGASHQLLNSLYLAASWSYYNRSIKNLGAGIVAGHSPVQFYAFSDNIFGCFDPLSSRNINLRFGINLIFGCNKKENIKKCGCEWLRNSEKKQERLQKLRKN
jgi:hypothetical protein